MPHAASPSLRSGVTATSHSRVPAVPEPGAKEEGVDETVNLIYNARMRDGLMPCEESPLQQPATAGRHGSIELAYPKSLECQDGTPTMSSG